MGFHRYQHDLVPVGMLLQPVGVGFHSFCLGTIHLGNQVTDVAKGITIGRRGETGQVRILVIGQLAFFKE